MSEYLQVSDESWNEFIRRSEQDTTIKSIGITAINGLESSIPGDNKYIESAREHLLRPYANRALWEACMEAVDVMGSNESTDDDALSHKPAHITQIDEIRLEVIASNDSKSRLHLWWEEQLNDKPWLHEDAMHGLQMIRANIHKIELSEDYKATREWRQYVYWHDPDNPGQKKVYGNLQPSHGRRKDIMQTLKAPESIALAHHIRRAANLER